MLAVQSRRLKSPHLNSAGDFDNRYFTRRNSVTRSMDWTADTIRQLRANAQVTQSQLARWLGVTVKQVKHLENRRRNPSGPVRRLLDIFNHELGRSDGPQVPRVQVLGASSPRRQPVAIESPQPPPATDAAMVWDT